MCRVTLVTGPPSPAGPEPGGLSPSGGEQGSLVDTLREVEPTSHMGVPRVWEKTMERIQEAVAQSGFIRRKMLLWAMSVMLEQNLTCPGRYGGLGHTPVCNRGSAGAGLSGPGACAEAPVVAGLEPLSSSRAPQDSLGSVKTDLLPQVHSPPREQLLTLAGGQRRGHSGGVFQHFQPPSDHSDLSCPFQPPLKLSPVLWEGQRHRSGLFWFTDIFQMFPGAACESASCLMTQVPMCLRLQFISHTE